MYHLATAVLANQVVGSMRILASLAMVSLFYPSQSMVSLVEETFSPFRFCVPLLLPMLIRIKVRAA